MSGRGGPGRAAGARIDHTALRRGGTQPPVRRASPRWKFLTQVRFEPVAM